MRQFNVLFRWGWTFLVVVTLGLAGCDGDDGAAGAAGAAGLPGADGDDGIACWDLDGDGVGDLPDEDINGDGAVDVADCSGAAAKVTPLESCAVCHDDGSFAAATDFHALDPIEAISNVTFLAVGADLTVTFDLADETGAPLMTYDEARRAYANNGVDRTDYRTVATLAHNGGGNYTITVAGAAAEALVDNRWLFQIQDSADTDKRTYFHVDNPANPFAADGPLVVGGDACAACHGPEGIRVHGSHFIASDGAEPCLTCHGTAAGSLVERVHQYHSGLRDPITYPTYMSNCSVCHSEDAQLAAANAMPVSGPGCLSCHDSMVNESWDFTGLGFHLNFADPLTTNCGLCHGDNPETPEIETGIARANVAAFHNDKINNAGSAALLDNDGVLWNGEDLSVTEGKKFNWQITNVADDKTNLAVTWQASYDGTPINVCNDDVAAGPVFHVGVDPGDIRIYRSYAQGDDFILGRSTSGAGQPARDVDVTVDNTDCVDGVATTTFPVEATDATVGRLALNGKPLVVSPAPDVMPTMVARAKTPTYDWLVGMGGPAPDRRAVVDSEKCVGCHVGSLYQHGGDRVDNVNTCLVCHNAASNEKYRRVAMDVDASEAYDGRTGETFEMKTMLHRIHSVNYEWPDGSYNPPYLIYRSRGIYAFANDVSRVPNWDVISTEGCTDNEIAGGQRLVFGADPLATADTCQPHNFHSATYPRSLNECTACHTVDDTATQDVNEDFTVIPDQTKSMAVTTEAGSTTDWQDQKDDTLQGAATTACVTCHADGASKGHAFQNSWTPQVFPEGRQTIIDAVN